MIAGAGAAAAATTAAAAAAIPTGRRAIEVYVKMR